MDSADPSLKAVEPTGFVCQDPELPLPDFLPRPWEEAVDWHLLHHALARLERGERLQTLTVLRSQGQWEALLASVDPTLVALVQDWLTEWPIAGLTLAERLPWPPCGTRQRHVDLLLDACTMLDREGRLTAPLIELLRELAAWPDPTSEVTVPEHVLSLEQVEQVCEALAFMPDADYLRTVLHLDLQLQGRRIPTARAHRILSAVAARSQDFLPTGELAHGHSGAFLLEGLVSGKHEE